MSVRRRAWPGSAALATVVAAVVLAVLGPAAPASADAPRPTDYRSEVLSTQPPLPPGVEVRVVGGDAFLEVTVEPGHTVVVDDYASSGQQPPPYLRFRADGTVERNERAVATAANESRYGTTDRTPDPDAPPRWKRVASDGSYAWHDHRIHWMSPVAPRAVAANGRVDLGGPHGTWEVPMTVDGTPTIVTGALVLHDAPSPVPWFLAIVVVAGAVVAAGLRWGPRVPAAVGIVSAVAACAASWSTWTIAPPGSGASPLPVLVAVVALVAAVGAFAGPERGRIVASSAAAASLVGWGITRWTVLAHAVLPTSLPVGMDRAATALAIGTGIAIAAVLVWTPPDRRPAEI